MDADARRQRQGFGSGELAQATLVVERERDGVHGALEQQQKAVGLVDFLAAMAVDEIASDAIEALREFGSLDVAQVLRQLCAVGQIADEHGAQQRRRCHRRRNLRFYIVGHSVHSPPPRTA
jgi:hypothetical protein